MNKDYYYEYLEESDKIINGFIGRVKEIYPSAFYIDESSFEKAVANYLWFQLMYGWFRKYYNNQRKLGVSKFIVINKLYGRLFTELLPDEDDMHHGIERKNIITFKHFKSLRKHKNKVLFYCKNLRQLMYLLPILQKIKEEVIVLVDFIVPDSLNFNDNIIIVEFDIVSDDMYIQNNYLEHKIPRIFHYINTFTLLLDSLTPKCIVILEGCHEEMEILSVLGKKRSINSVCVQQGWPFFITTVWKNMSYDYFLTWGREFNTLWKKNNPIPNFIATGYLYEVINNKKNDAITFFLQPPVTVIDESHLNELLSFICYCAHEFQDIPIYVREHPEHKLNLEVRKIVVKYPNVEIVTNLCLSEVFDKTMICVSLFSSTLMESIIHNVIPFIFDPTSALKYTPNLESEGLGVHSKSLKEARMKIDELIHYPEKINDLKRNIEKLKADYFIDKSVSAVENAINFLNNLSPEAHP